MERYSNRFHQDRLFIATSIRTPRKTFSDEGWTSTGGFSVTVDELYEGAPRYTGKIEKISGDKEVVLEVIENLLSNAFRYAKTKVEMEVVLTCSELRIRVKDDGVGFTVDKR